MPDFDLSITICSWNTCEDLRACLASLRAVRDEGSFEVIVVENNSEDDSAQMVREEFPEVRLLEQTRNLGFTGGHNVALAARRGRHAALLNSDTIVHPGALATLVAFLEEHSDVGVVGPKLLNVDGSLQYSCRRFPNPVAAAFRNTPLGKLFPKNRFTRDYLMTDWDHDRSREVDWVSGAAMFLHENALEKVGTLDPDYYMFCEDTDYCFRTWRAGLKVMYLPSARITHAIGRSTDQAPNRMVVRFHRSMLRFYGKNLIADRPAPVRWGLVAFAALALSARAGLFLAKNQLDALRRMRS